MSAATKPRPRAQTKVKIVASPAQVGELAHAIKAGESDDVLLIFDVIPGGARQTTLVNRRDSASNGPDDALLGTPLGNGWGIGHVRELRRNHPDARICGHVTGHLVARALLARGERDSGNPAGEKRLAGDLADLAREFDRFTMESTGGAPVVPIPAAPLPTGDVAAGFRRGKVAAVPPALTHGLQDLSDAMTRGTRDAWAGQPVERGSVVDVTWQSHDRLVAQKYGSIQRDEWVRPRADQSADAWLETVLLSFEPTLLLADADTAALVDLKQAAAKHRIAVGVIA